ncbi:MAG: heparinase II/III family protein [Anaerolineae bacterium]|nr:heparinase II/III family protein [Anaerolineae bacterium]
MLSRYNAVDIEQILRTTSPPPPFPPASDRASWAQVRAALGEDAVREIASQAEESAAQPVPALPATLYLEFARTGQREGYQRPHGERMQMLWRLALAECLSYEGRYLDPILDLAWAICEESSWALPAHQRALADMARPVIDLGAASTALTLAELDLLLGADLDPALAARIRYEVERRCTAPYMARHDHWWLYNTHLRSVNNWTAVCNAGVAGAALYLEPDPARLAELIARSLRSMDDYLATFDPDGGSTEGPGYWTYGFGHYTIYAHLLAQRTEGRIDPLGEPQIREIAQFPARTMLSPGWYTNYSDCDPHVHLNPAHLAYLAQRLDLPGLGRLAHAQPPHRQAGSLVWGLRSLFWRAPQENMGRYVPARSDWFGGMMWMIARHDPQDPDALVLAAKGGHNGEMHNQNDVGNIIVHVAGESVIPDIGRGRYTKDYFGPQRYEHLANSSLGHSVPVPNGQAQLPGKEHGATLLSHTANDAIDQMQVELKDAYPERADLASLQRTVTLHRDAPRGWVEVVDEARFASGPGTLESVLTTYATVEIGEGTLILRGERGALRVRYSAGVLPRYEVVQDVDMGEGPADVGRVILALAEPAQEGVVRLQIEPL